MTRNPSCRLPAAALGLLPVTAATAVVLLADRPRITGSITQWPGDDLAFAAAWFAAVVCTVWLGVTTLACVVALSRGDRALAHRVARWAPPIARRALQTALIGTWALSPTSAFASAPVAPLTVHVGAGGRVASVPATEHPAEVPVVRSPAAGAASDPPAFVPRQPALPHVHPAPPTLPRTHLVLAGENLWRIAQAEVARTTNLARPANDAVARYWQRLITANRASLRSGDPSLIFAGEVVTLPMP